MENRNEIKYSDFQTFLHGLEYNYPYRTSAIQFFYSMKDNLKYFKKEILSNLIFLSPEERKAYLYRLRNDLEELKEHIWADADTVQQWYTQFKSPKENDPSFRRNNELYEILSVDPSTLNDGDTEGARTFEIQNDFYNYYYGCYILWALTFIGEKMKELDPAQEKKQTEMQNENPMRTEEQRLKTNLSVEQLALLLKLLFSLKPEIFNTKTEAEFHRWIAASFASKKSGVAGISTNKLRILFNQPDSKAAVFWETHLYTMLDEIKKLK